MPSRYVVTTPPFARPDRPTYVILDLEWGGYCTLPDGHGNLLPLEWQNKGSAEAWLNRCYRAWASETVPAPRNWRPLPYEPSPWAMQ